MEDSRVKKSPESRVQRGRRQRCRWEIEVLFAIVRELTYFPVVHGGCDMSKDGINRIDDVEVQRVKDMFLAAAEAEAEEVARMLVSKGDHELFGNTEFQLRDLVLRVGAKTLEARVNDRAKKGGM